MKEPFVQILTDERLLAIIEDFLVRTGTKPSRFGLEVLNDGALVQQMRDKKRSLTLKTAERVLRYIAKVEAPSTPSLIEFRASHELLNH